MYNKTKIIATIGPVSESPEVIEKMIQAGVDVFRLNLKHNTLEWHEETIKKIKKIAEKMKVNVGTLADMQGPEIRIRTKDENGIEVFEGDIVYIGDDFHTDPKSIKLVPEKALATLGVDDEIFIDNGNLPLKIVDKVDGYLHAKVSRDYFIKNKKDIKKTQCLFYLFKKNYFSIRYRQSINRYFFKIDLSIRFR